MSLGRKSFAETYGEFASSKGCVTCRRMPREMQAAWHCCEPWRKGSGWCDPEPMCDLLRSRDQHGPGALHIKRRRREYATEMPSGQRLALCLSTQLASSSKLIDLLLTCFAGAAGWQGQDSS